MRAQSPALTRALCLLLTMASVFCGRSASNGTTNGTAITGNNTGASHMTTTLSAGSFTTKAQDTTAIRTGSTETCARCSTTPTARSSSTSDSHAKLLVSLLLFFCILIALFYCTYKWYISRGRPSCLEICGMVAESARSAWAALMELLRPSSKEEEKDEEMEAGEDKRQSADDDGDYNDNDDSSGNYSSVDGTAMAGGPKTNEEEDGRGNNREDDLMSVELKDEKSEGGKDDLAMQ